MMDPGDRRGPDVPAVVGADSAMAKAPCSRCVME